MTRSMTRALLGKLHPANGASLATVAMALWEIVDHQLQNIFLHQFGHLVISEHGAVLASPICPPENARRSIRCLLSLTVLGRL